MNVPNIAAAALLLFLLSVSSSFAETLERELQVVVEFDAEQSWVSETEEFGKQFYDATSSQRYELRTRLQADSQLQTLNLLDPDQEKRLKAKTIHLARQARKKLAAAGKPVAIPQTPAEKTALTQQMQEEQYVCQGDPECRRDTMLFYAAIFAAIEYPEAAQAPAGGGRYLYYEPGPACSSYARVTMQLSIQGEHYNKGEKEVVPFTEERSADVENPDDDIALCKRYLAVIDTDDKAEPLYVENFYLPSAQGETVITELGNTREKTERQPMPGDVLAWVTQQLKHADTSGEASARVRLLQPLNGISEQSGAIMGHADVKMRWEFSDAKADTVAE